MAELLSAVSVPKNNSQWEPIGIEYRGYPIYVNKMDGAMAYEQDYERLVSLPEEVEERICEIRLTDYAVQNASPEFRLSLNRRAN